MFFEEWISERGGMEFLLRTTTETVDANHTSGTNIATNVVD